MLQAVRPSFLLLKLMLGSLSFAWGRTQSIKPTTSTTEGYINGTPTSVLMGANGIANPNTITMYSGFKNNHFRTDLGLNYTAINCLAKQTTLDLELNGQAAGVYLVRVQSAEGQLLTKRLVVARL